MARQVIVVGDTTSHGGKVISGSAEDTIDGKPVARKNDLVDCPKHGINKIKDGDDSSIVNGEPVALEGHSTECGSTLISNNVTCSMS